MHRQSPPPARGAWLLIATAMAACTLGPSTSGAPAPTASAPSSAPVVGLPAGFPVLPGAVADDVQPGDDPAVIARWSSDQAGPVAYDFYIEALPAAGYPTTGVYPGGAVAVIAFRTPAGEPWELALTHHPRGTRIEVRIAQP